MPSNGQQPLPAIVFHALWCLYEQRPNHRHDQGNRRQSAAKTGELIDSPEQQAKGLVKQAQGLAQQKVDDAKEAAKEAADALKKRI